MKSAESQLQRYDTLAESDRLGLVARRLTFVLRTLLKSTTLAVTKALVQDV